MNNGYDGKRHPTLAWETRSKPVDRSARELAKELLPYLEAVANLHYLLDRHVEAPALLRELRHIEDEAFNSMLKKVLTHI